MRIELWRGIDQVNRWMLALPNCTVQKDPTTHVLSFGGVWQLDAAPTVDEIAGLLRAVVKTAMVFPEYSAQEVYAHCKNWNERGHGDRSDEVPNDTILIVAQPWRMTVQRGFLDLDYTELRVDAKFGCHRVKHAGDRDAEDEDGDRRGAPALHG